MEKGMDTDIDKVDTVADVFYIYKVTALN
jgi:hypothetical protein